MQDLFMQQGLHKALVGKENKSASMTNEFWEDLDMRALNTIHLCLANKMLFNVIGEEMVARLWRRMRAFI